jgi:hypothetical protein
MVQHGWNPVSRTAGALALLVGMAAWGWANDELADRPDSSATNSAPVSDRDLQPPREPQCPPNLKSRLKPLSAIRADIRLSPGPRPMDCADDIFDAPGTVRPGHCPIEFRWCPTNLYFHPPYFEDTPVERYGQTACPALQPALSTAHFFCALTTLPYRMAVERPCSEVYTLGYYRPGSPTPCLRQVLPCPTERQSDCR